MRPFFCAIGGTDEQVRLASIASRVYKAAMSTKEITSLLLFSVAKTDVALPHIARLKETLARSQYRHPVPMLVEHDFADADIKWMFDFSAQLGEEAYYDALSKFLESHEQFIFDVSGVDPNIPYYLSAQLSIDEDLAWFDISVPKIPNRLNALQSFHFSYSVWHLGSEREGTGTAKLQ